MGKCDRCDKNESHEPFNRCVECIKYGLRKQDIIVSNVLAYVNSYRHGGSVLRITEACTKHFSDEEIEQGKDLLYKEYERELSKPVKHQGGPLNSKNVLNMDDIFGYAEIQPRRGGNKVYNRKGY